MTLAVTPQFQSLPYVVPFFFEDAAAATQYQLETLVPYDCAVYAIAIRTSLNTTSSFYAYTISFQNYHTGEKLMDEPVQNLCIESDCRLLYKLPSEWFIRKNEKIICSINVLTDSTTVDIWANLLTHTTKVDPNPGLKPFIYSFPLSIGFQDVGGTPTSTPFNRVITGTIGKNALHNFDIHSAVLDVSGTDGVNATPIFSWNFSVQGFGRHKFFFNRPVLNGLAGGGILFQQGVPGTGLTITGFPNTQTVQYKFPRPERVSRNEIMRFDLYPAPLFLNSISGQTLSQQSALAVLGNHIL